MPPERVADHLNRTLHELFASDPRLFLLGEDVADPYGGAFRVTKGLSTAYPDRVVSTPLSENGIVGVANGLALTGNRVIVEMMFGDFIGLAFDQLVNFSAPSVTMYGRTLPLPLVVRCPVGGHRGYGPTHSKSPHKHLLGVPNLALYEVSPLHDARDLYAAAFARAAPCVLVEDKVLYTRRMCRDGVVDETFRYTPLPGPGHWVRVHAVGAGPAEAVLLAPGGVLRHALECARELRRRDGIEVEILVPAQLYPLALDPILRIAAAAGRVCVAEEATAGGTWGAEVAATLHQRLWTELRAPVSLVNSLPSVIPTAAHLERAVLVQPTTISAAIRGLVDLSRADRAGAGAVGDAETVAAAGDGPAGSWPIAVPTLNANDSSCVLVAWLCADGQVVAAGEAVAVVETAKATTDVEVARGGTVRRLRAVGDECQFGTAIGYLEEVGAPATPSAAPSATPVTAPPDPPVGAQLATVHDAADGARGQPADVVQAAVAAVVTRSHQTIPAAFCTARVAVDAALATLDALSDATGVVVDLPALIVKAVAELRPRFGDFFATVTADGALRRAAACDIGVTVDADSGLFVPVVRNASARSLDEVADDLVAFRLNALDGRFEEKALSGGSITVSLNLIDGIGVVRPLIMPPQAAVVSVGGVEHEVRLDPAGGVVDARVVTFGLAYDHRVINGRPAGLFLAGLKELIERPAWADPDGSAQRS